MKLAGWVLLPSCVVGLLCSAGLMIRAFGRLKATTAAGGTASVSELASQTRLALIPVLVGIGLSVCGLVLLCVGRRAGRREGRGFPAEVGLPDDKAQ